MAGDLSPFAALSAFASASPPHSDEPSPGSGQGSSLSRVGSRTVGFHEPPAVALEASPQPATCPLAARQHSMGSLGQLLRAAQAEQARPRLTISTARSLKAPASGRGRRVLRIAEHEEGPAGGSSSDLLGTTAPSHAATTGMSMHRSSSIDIGPSRLCKARTAPEALPDSLVMAAINTGYLEAPGPAASPASGSPAAASLAMSATGTLPSRQGPLAAEASEKDGGGATLPSRQGKLHIALDSRQQQAQPPPQQSPGLYHRTGSSSSAGGGSESGSTAAGGSGRPPMPVTPAALASSRSGSLSQRAGSGRSLLSPQRQQQQQQQQRQQQRGGQQAPLGATRQGSFKELFDAQTEAAMAQVTMAGLHEALRRRDEEIERLQQQLARVAAERDELREVATTTACTAAAATQHINAFSAVARGAAPPGQPASGAARGPAAGAGELQPPGGALPRLHSAGRPLRGLHRSAQALPAAQQQAPPAQPQQHPAQPQQPQPPAPPQPQQHAAEASPGLGMVSAFAGALQLPFSFE